jgi:hypothetical protein
VEALRGDIDELERPRGETVGESVHGRETTATGRGILPL